MYDYLILNLTWDWRLDSPAELTAPVVVVEPEDNGNVLVSWPLVVEAVFTLRDGRYRAIKDRTMVAAIAKSAKPSNSMATTGATEFHRLNNEQLLLNYQQIVRRLTAVIG